VQTEKAYQGQTLHLIFASPSVTKQKKWFHDVDDRSKSFFVACFDVDVASVDIDGCDVKVNVADFEQLVPKGKTD